MPPYNKNITTSKTSATKAPEPNDRGLRHRFKIGDIVQLNSGSWAMTVDAVQPDGTLNLCYFNGTSGKIEAAVGIDQDTVTYVRI